MGLGQAHADRRRLCGEPRGPAAGLDRRASRCVAREWPAPLRMLLLERQAQRAIGWLASVFGHGQDDRSRAAFSLLDPPEPAELAAIDDIASRWQIFATLLARKRADLTAPALGADAQFDRLLRDEKWSGGSAVPDDGRAGRRHRRGQERTGAYAHGPRDEDCAAGAG